MTPVQSSNECVAAVVVSLVVDVTTLRTWLRRAQEPSSDSQVLTQSENKDLVPLRHKVSMLKMKRGILKMRRLSLPRKVDEICIHRGEESPTIQSWAELYSVPQGLLSWFAKPASANLPEPN